MSKKYVIEIKPEYEDTTKGIIVLGARDSNLYVDALDIENLEELNSDYINEHYGSLQDEAYQRGLDDAWDAAKKLSWVEKYGGYGDRLDKVFDRTDIFDFLDYSPNEAIDKLKAYEEKHKADDEIKVGDELEHTVSGYTSKAIFLEKIVDDEDWYKCLFWTGCGVAILSYPKSQFKRTGKHYGIDKILEAMKE